MSQNYFAPNYDNLDLRGLLGPSDDERDSDTIRLQATQDQQLIGEAHRRGGLRDDTQFEPDRMIGGGILGDTLNLAAQIRQQKGMTPRELWESLHIARATGIAFDQAHESKNELVRAMHAATLGNDEELKKLLAASPNMLDFVKNRPPAELAAMIDDKPLWSLEGAQRDFLGDISHSLDIGNIQQERLRLGDMHREGRLDEQGLARLGELSRIVEVNAALREGEGAFDWATRSFMEQVPMLENTAWAGLKGGATGLLAGMAGGAALGSVVPGLGTAAGGVLGGKAGFRFGATAAVMDKSYRDNAAEVFLNLLEMQTRDGRPIDVEQARALATAAGIPMAGLDMLSLGTATKFIPGWSRLSKGAQTGLTKYLTQNPTTGKAVGEALFQAGKSTLAEGGAESLQEGVGILAEEAAIGLNLVDARGSSAGEAMARMGEAFKAGAVVRAPMVMPGTVQRAYSNVHKVRRIQQSLSQEQAVNKMLDSAAASETVKNAPEFAEQAIADSAAVMGVGSMYINPEVAGRILFQDDAGLALAENLGVTPEALAESLELGVDLAIPTEKVLLHLAQSPLREQLQPNLRLSPAVDTVGELNEIGQGLRFDAEQFAFLDEVLRDTDEARTVYERRRAIAEPYVGQLVQAGYTQRQAEHSFAPYAAHAEVMAPLFGQTPQDYLAQRLQGFTLTSPEMFGVSVEQLNQRALREMSKEDLALINPLLATMRGRLDGKSLRDYDSQGYNELRALYGQLLFKSKSNGGLPLDFLADEAVRAGLLPEGSGANELLAALQNRRRGVFFQTELTTRKDGPEPAPDSAVVNVVPVDTGIVPKFSSIAELRGWLKDYFSGREPITIGSTGAQVVFTVRGLKDSAKSNRVKKDEHRSAYGQLDRLIEEAVYAGFDSQDSRHPNVQGQDIYYSAMDIDGTPYAVRLRLDVPLQGNALNYKDHKVTEI
ncbi:MAG: hypothetical protein LBM64_01500, partial [Deltaproteobacteria bacterium]|nr:hypothetical protein [Deltaproteobacteria bacterium]